LTGLKQIDENIPLYIVPIDDGSIDNTFHILSQWHQLLPMTIVQHARNRGIGAALWSGIQSINPKLKNEDVVLTMDADGSHPSETIPLLLREISGGFDIVVASSFVLGGIQVGVPWFRRYLSRVASIAVRKCTGIK